MGFSRKDTLLKGVFPTQGSSRVSCIAGGLSPLSHQRSPRFADTFPFCTLHFRSLNRLRCFAEGLRFVPVLLLSVFSFTVVVKKSLHSTVMRVLCFFQEMDGFMSYG